MRRQADSAFVRDTGAVNRPSVCLRLQVAACNPVPSRIFAAIRFSLFPGFAAIDVPGCHLAATFLCGASVGIRRGASRTIQPHVARLGTQAAPKLMHLRFPC
jgi:hypothetical protein